MHKTAYVVPQEGMQGVHTQLKHYRFWLGTANAVTR
jgi:hypothetical protein